MQSYPSPQLSATNQVWNSNATRMHVEIAAPGRHLIVKLQLTWQMHPCHLVAATTICHLRIRARVVDRRKSNAFATGGRTYTRFAGVVHLQTVACGMAASLAC
jgi:hypothetical protein